MCHSFFCFFFVLFSQARSKYLSIFYFLLFSLRRELLLLLCYSLIVFKPALAEGFLLEIKCEQVSRTLLSILTDFNNVVIRMVSSCPLISMSSSLLTNPPGIVPSALIIIGITVTFKFNLLL